MNNTFVLLLYPTCTEKPLFFFKITSLSQYTTICFVSYTYSVFNEHFRKPWRLTGRPKWTRTTVNNLSLVSLGKSRFRFIHGFKSCLVLLVGPSGLEPPTSCLSGTRSNLLSYEPMWLVSDFCFTWLVEMMGFEPMTPCLQGRCSPSWATPPF